MVPFWATPYNPSIDLDQTDTLTPVNVTELTMIEMLSTAKDN